MSSMTQEIFAAIDTNGDSSLSREELLAATGAADECCGCCGRGCSQEEDLKRYFGDWLLVGLSLFVLLSLSGKYKH